MAKKTKKSIFYIVLAVLVIVLGRILFSMIAYLPFLFQLLFNHNIDLKHTDDKVNILLMGIGGGNHDGPNLTDTIIFSSIDTKTNKISMISIPRDLWVPDIKSKINAAYADGEAKKKGSGLVLSEAVVGKITGQEIDYGVVVDFDGFVKAVDLIGGLDVNVDRTFDDYEYPVEGKEDDTCGLSSSDIQQFIATDSAEVDIQQEFPCRYTHVHFDKGLNHMDGKTALEFVRSRHALGPEGSDFARSARQEKVIKAFKDKIFSLQILTDPGKLINLYSIVKQSISTDIKDTEFDDFIRLIEKVKNAKIETGVLDTGDSSQNRQGLLINPPISEEFGYQWVLIPSKGDGDFSEIQSFVNCELTKGNCTVPIPSSR
jgi:LCP family protein required for cell wall assembly